MKDADIDIHQLTTDTNSVNPESNKNPWMMTITEAHAVIKHIESRKNHEIQVMMKTVVDQDPILDMEKIVPRAGVHGAGQGKKKRK